MHYHFLQHWGIFLADFKMHQLLIMMYSILPKFWRNLLNFDLTRVLFTSHTSMKWCSREYLFVFFKLTYLGTCFNCIFNYRNKFTKAKKRLSEQGRKTLFALIFRNIRNMHVWILPLNYLYLTVKLVVLLTYNASKIWETHIYTQLFGVKGSTCSSDIDTEKNMDSSHRKGKFNYWTYYWYYEANSLHFCETIIHWLI